MKLIFEDLPVCAALLGVACTLNAQTYQVGPEHSNQNPKPAGKKQSQKQPQARNQTSDSDRISKTRDSARAAELALQRGDKAQALEFAQRAAQAAPNDAQLWFLLGYAARLNARFQQSVDAYSHGLRAQPVFA